MTLQGQTVVVLGGTAGIGLATARLAREHGAELILTARDAGRLREVGGELEARTESFDVTDFARLEEFLAGLAADHILVTGPGPYYAPLPDFDVVEARRDIESHLFLPILLTKLAAGRVRGSLVFMSGTGGRRTGVGMTMIGALTAAMPALVRNLALEAAPTRVNLIAAGFVDTPLSATLLGEGLEARRQELRDTLPIRRVVGPDDIAALAVHLMTNTALTGATYDIDGGQQLV